MCESLSGDRALFVYNMDYNVVIFNSCNKIFVFHKLRPCFEIIILRNKALINKKKSID